MATCGSNQDDDCDDCVQVVRDTKTVQIPCTRNTYKQYTVKVPRQVTEKVPRAVTYMDYENRQKQVPYTVNKSERRVRLETQKFQVPVTTYYKRTVMETRERQVPVEYYVDVPETKYRTLNERVPIQRTKIEYADVVKTVYDTQTRTRCVPETKIITKQIPVYNVVAKPAPPCPPDTDCGGDMTNNFVKIDTDVENKKNDDEKAMNPTDTNDTEISYEEYTAAKVTSNLPKSSEPRQTYLE